MFRSYLQKSRHGTVFYFRRRIPLDLVRFFPSATMLLTLGTSNKRIATIKARGLASQLDVVFIRLRKMNDYFVDDADDDTEDGAVRANYIFKVDFHPSGLPKSVEVQTDPNDPKDRADAERALAIALAGANTSGPLHNLVENAPTKSLGNAIAEYFDKVTLKPTTRKSYAARTESLSKYFGADTEILSIDQSKFVAYCEHIKTETSRGARTQGNYITVACTFLNWHRVRMNLQHQLLVAATLKPKGIGSSSLDRDAFKMSEIGALFENAARYKVRQPAKFWVTVATAFLGCRVEELCQVDIKCDLHHDDEHDLWYFNLNENLEEDGTAQKSIKKSQWRAAPIHPALVRAGFVDYLNQQLLRGHRRPFEAQWAPSRDLENGAPKWSHAVSKWGGRELSKLVAAGVLQRGRRTYFHSLRHTHATHLSEQGIDEEVRSALHGHEYGAMNAKLYNKMRHNPQALLVKTLPAMTAYEAELLAALTPSD